MTRERREKKVPILCYVPLFSCTFSNTDRSHFWDTSCCGQGLLPIFPLKVLGRPMQSFPGEHLFPRKQSVLLTLPIDFLGSHGLAKAGQSLSLLFVLYDFSPRKVYRLCLLLNALWKHLCGYTVCGNTYKSLFREKEGQI